VNALYRADFGANLYICVCVWPSIAPRLNFSLDTTQPLPPSLHQYKVKFEPWWDEWATHTKIQACAKIGLEQHIHIAILP